MKIHQLSVRLGMDLSNELMENRDSLFSFLGNVTLSLEDVDWERTRAYAMGNMSYIFINLQGREPKGCVRPGKDYERTLEEITDQLYQMKDPETNESIIDQVYRGEDLYSGPYLPNAPDLFPMSKEFRYHLRGDYLFMSNHWIEKFWLISGFHRAKGILMAMGPNVKKGHRVEGKNILDIAPTVLSLMGVPIPSDMDGQCLLDLFENDFSIRMAPLYYEAGREEKPEERNLSDEEQREIKKRLKELGYIG